MNESHIILTRENSTYEEGNRITRVPSNKHLITFDEHQENYRKTQLLQSKLKQNEKINQQHQKIS